MQQTDDCKHVQDQSTVNQYSHQPSIDLEKFSFRLSSSINRFPPPHHHRQSSNRSTFLNIYQQIRSRQPIFTNPFHSTRERFQVNSIGRPIFRTTNNNHLFQVYRQ